MEPATAAAPVAAVAAAGGAGAPPPMEPNASAVVAKGAEEPLLGLITTNGGSMETLFTESKKREMPVLPPELAKTYDRQLGTLTDPSIHYFLNAKGVNKETIRIHFKRLSQEDVGFMEFRFGVTKLGVPHIYLASIIKPATVHEKGYGKRMMAVLWDIARRRRISEIKLESKPGAVSFYLGLLPPFAFNDPDNETKYMTRYRKLSRKTNNKTARREAGQVFKEEIPGENGKVQLWNSPVSMTAKLRSSRRTNRRKGTRRRASKK